LQTADAGPDGAVVNDPVTRFVVSAAGVTLGAGAARIRKVVATTVAWRPGRVAAGGTSALAASLYGTAVGDVVGAAFAPALPAGCLLQATVTAPGRVRVELFNLSGAPVSLDAGRVRLESWLHEPMAAPPAPADDIAQLVAELGDVAAIYDARVGVSAPNNAVARWADARGANGYGPALVPSGTATPPYYNPVAATVTGRGGTGLVSTPSAAFDLSHPTVLVFVGAVARVWSGDPVVSLGVGNGARHVTLDSKRAGVIEASIDGRTQLSPPVGASATTRLVALTVPTASTFSLQVGGGAAVGQHIATAFPGGPYQLGVLIHPSGAPPSASPSSVRAVLVLRGALESERWERLAQWAAAVHGAESIA
jgi:hypothetical protein